jgi:hypothetical protein
VSHQTRSEIRGILARARFETDTIWRQVAGWLWGILLVWLAYHLCQMATAAPYLNTGGLLGLGQ